VTCTMTHATPAGFASHVASRGSEADIAAQMLANRVDVMFGGGSQYWLPKGVYGGVRKDGKDLLAEARQLGYQVITSRDQLFQLSEIPVIGLFGSNALKTYSPEPLLSEMAVKALALLNTKSKDWFAPSPKFFVMIEGSQIDWAGHANDRKNSIRQTLMFDMAVKEALDFAMKDRKTLVIVTADHDTGGMALLSNDKHDDRLDPKWTTKDHSGMEVPLYAFGPGSEKFEGIMDNTDISKKILGAVGIQSFPLAKEDVSFAVPAVSVEETGDPNDS